MIGPFQSLFENVCRCFGHSPRNGGRGLAGEPLEASSTPNHSNRDKNENDARQQNQHRAVSDERKSATNEQEDNALQNAYHTTDDDDIPNVSQRGQPPRHEMKPRRANNGADNETAQALAQAKLAANPPRYRTKRKRSSQTREEIFRLKNGSGGGKSGQSSSRNQRNSDSSGPVSDFSRLLNPSLALCFATPIRGTEEEQEEQDMRSVDCSDTATLNTNGEDTITSTLYFDSKYAHIQESTPPMQLFNEFKIGQAKDEIRTIMATDSHSSVRMMNILNQQQQERDRELTDQGSKATRGTKDVVKNKAMKRNGRSRSQRGAITIPSTSVAPSTSSSSTIQSRIRSVRKDTVSVRTKEDSSFVVEDEEMEDAVPDMKPISSSTDSSRLSANATNRK